MVLVYHPEARGSLPLGMGVNGPLLLGNLRVIVRVFARAMNPCVVAARPVHRHTLARVRGVPLGKPPAGKTCAVTLDASKYLGTLVPSSSRGHRASSSFAGWPETRSSWLQPWGVSPLTSSPPCLLCRTHRTFDL
jgi:hypothetical protein